MIKTGKTQQQYASIIRMLSARHKVGGKAKLLEIGAGEMVLKQWIPNSVEYHSLDFGSEKNPSLTKGKKYTYLFDLDSGRLPVKSETYDYVVCFETLEHVMYPERVVREIKRVAKKDAVFFLSLPNEYNFAQRVYYMLGIKTYCDEPFQVVEKHLHIHKPRVEDIISLFGKYFKITNVEYIWQSTKLPYFVDRMINMFAQLFPSLFSRIVVVTAINK